MTANKSVQFRKIDDILDMYEQSEIPYVAIWQGNQLNMVIDAESMEEGKEKLAKLLRMLKENLSAAIYTLSFYKNPPADGVDNKTPYNASFNFRLIDEIHGYGTATDTQYNDLKSEIAALKLENERLLNGEDEDDEEEPEDDLLGRITGILANPKFAPIVDPLLARFGNTLGDILTTKPANPQMTVVKKISGIPAAAYNEMTDEQKINQAVKILMKREKIFLTCWLSWQSFQKKSRSSLRWRWLN